MLLKVNMTIFLKVLKSCKSVQINFTIFQQSGLPGVIQESNFAPALKKIATILLLLFTFSQATPAMAGIFSDYSFVLITEEENKADKSETEKKEKKVYPVITYTVRNLSQKINTAFHEAEKIHPNPCLEKLTPPPNFS